MMWTRRTVAVLLAAACLNAAPAWADENPDDAVAESLPALQADVAELRAEVKALRTDMQKIMAELQALRAQQQAAQRPPQRPQQRPPMQLLGKDAPPQTFKTTGGEDVSLGGKADKVKLAFFYASWCGFCQRTLPGIEKLHNDYKDKDVEVIAINLDDRTGQRARTEEQSLEHYRNNKFTMPMFMDNEKTVGRAYKVSSFPTSFVIGKDGKVEAVHIGGPVGLDKTLAGEIETLLAGKSLVAQAKSATP